MRLLTAHRLGINYVECPSLDSLDDMFRASFDATMCVLGTDRAQVNVFVCEGRVCRSIFNTNVTADSLESTKIMKRRELDIATMNVRE